MSGSGKKDGNFIHVRGARQHNLRNIDVSIPRDAFVVFTGVSGSGKSSLAFGTIFAESQRRYFESIAPYARRLIEQLPAPHVTEITGLPPAVALQQRRAEPTARSSVGTLTTLSNSLRMLFSRAGDYPAGVKERLDSDAFSPNTPQGACKSCHGIGMLHNVTEASLVPDPSLSIRQHAVAAWPGAWQGKNYQDILEVLGYDVECPFSKLAKKDRQWILFTDEKPVVTVHAKREAHRIQRPYQGTYMSAASYVRHTFATTGSATLRKRVARFMTSDDCPECSGKRLNRASLDVKIEGFDIAELSDLPLSKLAEVLTDAVQKKSKSNSKSPNPGETAEVKELIANDLLDRIKLLTALGLDYLALDRTTPTLSAGELQRLRLTTQLRSGLFGVVYILDEPSAGLHPADTEALLQLMKELLKSGNSLFVVEHDMNLVRQADWIVDIGPAAGEGGGSLLYSGVVSGLADCKDSITRRFVFCAEGDHAQDESVSKSTKRRSLSETAEKRKIRSTKDWLTFSGITRNNLSDLKVEFPLGVLTAVTGISGSGKSSLVSHVLAETIAERLGLESEVEDDSDGIEIQQSADNSAIVVEGMDSIKRLVCVDQKPIGRTPRSNLATYTGLFDNIRQKFAATDEAKSRGYNAGRFSFNVVGGRCATCEGEGYVSVELMFLPSVYTPCSECHGTRYNEETLQIKYRGKSIAQVLDMTVDAACDFFTEIPAVARALNTLRGVGLGYLRIGQAATELSGGEAQRIKLSTELQRVQKGTTLYLLDEPTAGLHPADVEQLMSQIHSLVDAGNTVVIVEHDMDVVAQADWVIDLGPGAGFAGGKVVAAGTPQQVSKSKISKTAKYLSSVLSHPAKCV